MKKRIIFIAGMLMLRALIIEAQTIKVNNTKASVNEELEIKVIADANIKSFIATGFCIELPEGFSVAGVEGVKGDDVQSDHVVRVGQTGNSKLRVAIYSLANSAFELYSIPPIAGPGQSGGGGGGGRTARQKAPSEEEEDIPLTLCTLKLKAPNNIGSFTGKLSKIEFATSNHSLVTSDAVSFNISINGNGDVNGDGEITAQDASLVLQLVAKKIEPTADGVKYDAADVNGDGDVTAQDASLILQYVAKKITW